MIEREHWLRDTADSLAAMVAVADEAEDFVLAAKIEDARCTVVERMRAGDDARS